ncbi:hypothetical protein [Streptomyces sp. NPDC057616]|uniref:hypothetical protein n=1 Tax=Streptomyces sp. NPDC057616 TaxID=3346183 RepID=UPI0036C834B8
MKTRLRQIHGGGPRVAADHTRTSEILLKFFVLAGLLYLVVRVFQWGAWIAFAGASVYLLWEITRINGALGELARLRDERSLPRRQSGQQPQ